MLPPGNQDRAMGDVISGIWTMEEGQLSSSYLEIYLNYEAFFSDRKGRAIYLRYQQVHGNVLGLTLWEALKLWHKLLLGIFI